MAERVARVLARHGEHEHARGSVVGDGDLRLARVVVPLERDRVASVVAGVEFQEHAWFLSGPGVASVVRWQRELTAQSVRLAHRGRARVGPGGVHGTGPACTPGPRAAGGRYLHGGSTRRSLPGWSRLATAHAVSVARTCSERDCARPRFRRLG